MADGAATVDMVLAGIGVLMLRIEPPSICRIRSGMDREGFQVGRVQT